MSGRRNENDESPCWNEHQALEMSDNDAQLLQELLRIWTVQAPDFIDSLRAAAVSSQAGALGNLLHRLKGSLQIIAAKPALALIASLEQQLYESRVANRHAMLIELVACLEHLDREVVDWLARNTVAPSPSRLTLFCRAADAEASCPPELGKH